MATILNGAAVMDATLLLIAGNETCPQPQISEHGCCRNREAGKYYYFTVADQEQRYRAVLYVVDSPVNSPWTQTCIRQVSHL
jgi:hypothetical protein